MKSKITKHEYVSNTKMSLIVVGFIALYWLFESFLHAVIWNDRTLAEQLFLPDNHEMWMRLLVVFIIILLGFYTKRMLNKQMAAEEQTKLAYAELSQIFNTSVDGMCVIDKDFNVLRINETFNTLLGISKDEAAGKKCYEIFYGSECNTQKCPLKLILGGETRVEFESEKTHIKGAGIPCYVTATPFRAAEGELIGIVENFRDISDRKQTEAYIKNIFESMGEGLAVIGRDYRIITANRAYGKQVNAPIEDIIGKHCYEVLYHVAAPCHETGNMCVVRDVFETGAPQKNIYTYKDNKGNPVYIESSAYPVKDATGRISSVIETINDITEKTKLEEQLRHAQKLDSIGTLAGGIAHDFNNILNVIIGFGSLMEMKMREDDPLRSHLKEIFTASERATHLTRSLLTFSRKQIMEIEPINVNEIVIGIKKMLSSIIGEDIKLVTIQKDKDPIVMADYGQIEQVLMNLAVNARDAMPAGGGLTIETSIVELDEGYRRSHGYGEPGRYALISVADTGVGMDEETREKIFEPFFTTKEAGKGTGLGLSIVYGITKQHDGYIDVLSKQGKGTTFNIYLPLTKSGTEETEMVALPPPAGGTETILLAEDEAQVRKLTKEVLEGAGYTVIEAQDGLDAVDKFMENKNKIRLLLFDVIMPNKNGREAFDEIKKINHEVKSIFISGYSADLLNIRGVYNKDLVYLAKPVAPSDLLRKIREVLDK
ncbi:MAG: hypothetical protein A2X59_06180 [Nitrospirae bacterium GWC2_42_7]|nr:MAG: hypothetical protein A2X59_06180 [Nitrospirae bacterium GWC2_42_7]